MCFEEALVKEDKVWREIAVRLGVPDEICKKRWKSLRDTFKKVKQRSVAELRSGSTALKKWKYFDLLAFLDDIPTSRYAVAYPLLFDSIPKVATSPPSFNVKVLDSPELTPQERITVGNLDKISEVVTSAITNAPIEFVAVVEPQPNVESPASITQAKSRESTPQVSSRASTPKGLPHAKIMRCESPIQEKFNLLLDMAISSVTEKLSTVEVPKTSTWLLFEFLGKRIKNANLSQRQINEIENAVFRAVWKKLDEFSDIDSGV